MNNKLNTGKLGNKLNTGKDKKQIALDMYNQVCDFVIMNNYEVISNIETQYNMDFDEANNILYDLINR